MEHKDTGKVISATLKWTTEKQGKYEINRVYIKFTPKDIISFLKENGWKDGDKLFVILGKNQVYVFKNKTDMDEFQQIPSKVSEISKKLIELENEVKSVKTKILKKQGTARIRIEGKDGNP